MNQAARGKQALTASNFDDAIAEYTAALEVSPTSPDYLIQRATALHRAKRYDEALTDANNAVLAAQKRAKREFIVEAQFRRACALYCLERYGDALYVFMVVYDLDKKHKMFPMWYKKTKMALGKLSEDDPRKERTVKETPEAETGDDTKKDKGKAAINGTSGAKAAVAAAPSTAAASTTAPAPAPAAPQQTPPAKIRHEWYQNNDNVYFTLFAKGVPKDQTQIDIKNRSLSISYPLTTGSSYDFTLEPLFGEIQPDRSTSRVLGTKIEITLVKATPGQKWGALEDHDPSSQFKTTAPVTQAPKDEPQDELKDQPFNHAVQDISGAPAYPTSSKTGPKNWDKITQDLGKREGDANGDTIGDDDEGGDPGNAFFKHLFKNATPETQRAMMKSYTESNGTVLSTNWDEVSKGTVEPAPPEGMEEKAWEK